MQRKNHVMGRRLFLLLTATIAAPGLVNGEEAAAVARRLHNDVEYLASDQLEGRGIGTVGLLRAAEFISDRFRELGLKPAGSQGSFLQKFTIRDAWKSSADKTSLVLTGPRGESIELKLGVDYQPLVFGDSGSFDAPVVFVGYGISAPEEKYDDYADVNVEGKVVLMLRREPQQDDKDSPFAGKENSPHASITSKVKNAWVHKAKAVLLVTDPFTVNKDQKDPLVKADYIPSKGSTSMPLAQVSGAVVDRLLAETSLESLEEVEAAIDADLKPRSSDTGWMAKGTFDFEPVTANAANVVGVIEGEGPLRNETIVIGGHYDHLGYGGKGSLARVSNVVHNGADDNASGTALVLELAKRFALRNTPPKRRLVFIAFSAEERGLLGSRHYAKEDPLYPLKDTVAMVNYDMVGRLKDGKLTVFGVKTGDSFEKIIDEIDPDDLELKKVDLGARNSDHATFYQEKIPALHLFTGTHRDYHRPSDDSERVNAEGMRKVADFSERLIDALADGPRPKYVMVKSSDPHAGMKLPSGGRAVYLGTVPDYGDEAEGARIQEVIPGAPAQKGGMKDGDLIVELGGVPVKNVETYARALYSHKPGDKVKIVVVRNGEKVTLNVTLGSKTRGR